MSQDKTKIRKINTKKIIFSSMFVTSLVIVMVSISFSWFFSNSNVTLSGITVNVVEAENLEIKEPDGEWSHSLNLYDKDSGRIFDLKQITGNGISFFAPIQQLLEFESTEEGYLYENYEIVGFEPIPEEKYSEYMYIYDFSARIEQDNDLYLAECNATGRGAVALRMALFSKEADESYKPILVWIPDVKTKLSNNETSNLEELETEVVFRDENGEMYPIEISEASGSTFVDEVKYVWGDIASGEHKIAELISNEELELRIVIWLDGEDRDCRDYLPHGEVNIAFNLTVDNKASE